jgi:hypothetical protein
MIKAFPPSIFSSMHITRNAIEIRGEEGEEKKKLFLQPNC